MLSEDTFDLLSCNVSITKLKFRVRDTLLPTLRAQPLEAGAKPLQKILKAMLC